MEDLTEKIKEKRKLRPASVKTYVGNIVKLSEKINGERNFKNLDFLKDYKKVVDTIKDYKLSSRKTALAAIVVGLSSYGDKYEDVLNKYRDDMYSDAKEYKSISEQQNKTPKENENWVALKRLRNILTKIKKDLTDREAFKKDTLTKKEMDKLQQYVAGFIYIGDDSNPPLRNDITPMSIVDDKEYRKMNEEQLKKNYLVVQSRNKKFFSLGEYKTAKQYGLKKIELGKKLNSVMNIWLKYNPTKHLIFNNKGESMSPNGLTKLLNKTFEPTGKKISTTLLRHIYITERFPPTDTLNEKQEVAEKMGHSTNQQELYKRK